MNSRERIIAALERREPDRLPTFEWKVANELIQAFVPNGNYFDFVDSVGHDAVCCAPTYEKTELIDKDTFVDEFGITRHLTGLDRYPVSVGHPVTDMRSFKKYQPPPLNSPIRLGNINAAIERFGREKAIVVNLHDVFSFPRDLMGFDRFLMAFILEPKLVREILRFSVDYNLELAKLVRKKGIEIVGIGDDFADNKGPFVSPEMFREFVYPEFKRVVEGYKKMGFYVIKHSDGNLNPILDMMIEAGIDCLDPIDPLGGMDIGCVRERYGDRISRKGNIDCVNVLVSGTETEVETAVRECIKKGAIGGGHIISTSNSLHSGVRPELYNVMLDVMEKHGSYPIKI